MKGLSFILALCATTAAFAQDSTPFSQQPYRAGASNEPTLLNLADVMTISQVRHIKLWQAAKAENWALATYEIDKLRDALYRSAALYVNIPVPLVKAADEPMSAMNEAAKKRDVRAFDKAFADLTVACNSCHQAAGLDFIRIRAPSTPSFSNQDFSTPKR